MKAEYCVFVGRFQPFHNGHLKVVLNALKEADNLIIAIGSVPATISVKNPFTFEDRCEMILKSIPEDLRDKVVIVPLRDHTYRNNHWIAQLQTKVAALTSNSKSIKIIGHFKDDSSFYLNHFPQWELIQQPYFDKLDSTYIRDALFAGDDEFIANSVSTFVGFELLNFRSTEVFKELKKTYDFTKKYKDEHDFPDKAYGPTFVTTDAVVIKSGHVLVIKRKLNPGKGMLALPGGFLQPCGIYKSAVKELKEETNIKISPEILKRSCIDQNVFDHPERDPRGRFITHAFFFDLGSEGGPCPEVKGGDDAAEAFWLQLGDLPDNEANFYADHFHIIKHFISRT